MGDVASSGTPSSDEDAGGLHVLHCPTFKVLELAHHGLREQRTRHCVVAVSNNLASARGEIPTHTVHNGVDADVWRPMSATTLRASTGRCVWAGRSHVR